MVDNPANVATDFIVRLGSALVATGAPVDFVEEILEDISNEYGVTVGYSILPTGLIVLGHEGTSIVASIASSQPATLRFDQTADLFRLVEEVRSGQVDPAAGSERLDTIDAEKRRAGFLLTVLGHAVLTVGLALLLDPSWRSVGAAALFGLLVGVMKLVTAPHRTLAKLLPAGVAFAVTLCVLLLRRHGAKLDELQTIIPPLVTFLPGATLTVGTLELAEGSIVTGSSRFIAGIVQLVLLVLGIVVAVSLVTVPAANELGESAPRVGAWAPWLGVALFGLGSALFYSARAQAYPALLAVLYVAFSVQFLTKSPLGGYLSAFLGASAAVLVASYIYRHLHGPPFLVTFLPAFWLLVPGVLSLIGVARLAVGSVAAQDFAAALLTILAIALGVITSLGADRSLMKRFGWW